MTSGIYRLTFSSGNTYIGKSINIENRWLQHADKFSKGKAAANMQAEFDKYGTPTGEILTECHRDHIDLVEEYYINRHKPPLNGTYPNDPFIGILDEDIQPIWTYLGMSTIEHVNLIKTLIDLKDAQSDLVNNLRKEVKCLSTIRDAEELEADINRKVSSCLEIIDIQEEEINTLLKANELLATKLAYTNKPWWQRIFR